MLRRTFLMLVWIATSDEVAAQQLRTPAESEVSIGLTVPVSWNNDVEIVTGKVTAVAALWGDVSVTAAQRVRLDVAIELPASSGVQARHPGSAGYVVTYRHRDIPIMTLVGLRMRSTGRVRPVAMIGGGPMLWRTSTTFQRTGFGRTDPPFTSQNNDVSLALAGGLDVQVAFGTRFGIVTRTLARYVWNSNATDADPFKGSFGPFSLSPGVALQIRL